MTIDTKKVIYSMIGVSKYYDKKAVLKDIYLSYFYGAKIGVIGLNGSGKSSLLRILAGVDQEFQGKTAVSPGFTIGFLEQEPRLDTTKTVREIVEQGVQPIVDLLREYDEINAKFAEPMSDDACSPEVRSAAWRSAGCCFRSRTSSFLMNRPTISMPNPSPGSSTIFSSTKEQ
jgi:sulfate-transporting ATPase